MSGRHTTTERDRRRRALGQNFLADAALVDRLIDQLDIVPGDLVVDIGAGTGALTLAVAARGAEVWAVEPDPAWASALRTASWRAGVGDLVRVIRTHAEQLRLPTVPYRVVANPPFGRSTQILAMLLDDPSRGPTRADLVLQREVVHKHAAAPPHALRTAAWTPWWTFERGLDIDRSAFRPRPSIDASVLHVRRRDPALLPTRLAPTFIETLRPAWTETANPSPSRRPRTARSPRT